MVGVGNSTVGYVLKSRGTPIRGKTDSRIITEEDKIKIVNLYEGGYKPKQNK